MGLGKKIVRKWVFPGITALGVERLFPFFSKHNYVVLEYHGVTDKVDLAFNGRHLDTHQFEQHINYFQKNFDIVPLKEIFRYEREGIKPNKKTVALTFDDGYLNNYTTVFPILKKYNVPATFFIITAGLESNDFVVWPDVFDIIARYSVITKFSLGGIEFTKEGKSFYTGVEKENIYDYIKQLGSAREALLSRLKAEINFNGILQNVPIEYWKLMDTRQVREVFDSGLIEIGSHTHLHYNLGNIPIPLVKEEISMSKLKLEEIIMEKVQTIAFPDGSYSEEVKQNVLESGYFNLIAVDLRVPSDVDDKNILDRCCISNTTTFESNMIQMQLKF